MIDVKIKLDMKELSGLDVETKTALAKGVSHGSEVIKEHALEDHGLGAHSKQRYVRDTGELNRSIQQMPVKIEGGEIKAGVIARKDYAAPVEEGHGNAAAYPFMEPAIESKEVQDEILDIIADELSKVFK